MSTEYDIIFVQESTELTEDEWEALSTRLSGSRLPYQQLLADCNPAFPQHWLKRREKDGHSIMLNSFHTDNPIFYDEHGNITERGIVYMARLDQLTGVRRARLRDGLWVAAEGAIYPDWTDERNMCDWFEPPDDWRRFCVVDFGFTNPLVVQWWAVDPDDCMYLYREFYHTRKLVEDVAEEVIKAYQDYWDLEAIVCDWDAEDRATLERHLDDRPTTQAEKDVSSGIQLVQSRIRGDKEKPRAQIVLMRDALVSIDGDLQERGKPLCTADEIPGYAWMPDNKELPVKIDDHGCDCMKYACAYMESNGSAADWVILPH
jgi:phage terminase large subunit